MLFWLLGLWFIYLFLYLKIKKVKSMILPLCRKMMILLLELE